MAVMPTRVFVVPKTLTTKNAGLCYTMRSYGFAADGGGAEAPKLTSYTTCEPGGKVRSKLADGVMVR